MIRQELIKNYAQSMERERNKLGITKSEMAKKLDMSLSNYKKIISGDSSNISLYVAHLMHELTGKWTFELCGEHTEELELIQKIRSLSESQKKYIIHLLDIEIELSEKYDNAQDYISVFVPTGNMEDGMIYDSQNIIKVNAAPYREKFGDSLDYGIQITSTHLHPVYMEGDILLISRRSIRDGDTGIFYNKENGRIYIRKLVKSSPIKLIPVNEFGNTICIDASDDAEVQKWSKLGRVLCKMRIKE